jgi:hypothetical protein
VKRDDPLLALGQRGKRGLQGERSAFLIEQCRSVISDARFVPRPIGRRYVVEAEQQGRRFAGSRGLAARLAGDPILSAELVEDGSADARPRVSPELVAANDAVFANGFPESEHPRGEQIVRANVGRHPAPDGGGDLPDQRRVLAHHGRAVGGRPDASLHGRPD